MPAIYKEAGQYVDYTPGGAVAAGDVAVLNDLVAVATTAIAANTLGAVAIEGVFALPKKTTTDTFSVGEKVFWEAGEGATGDDTDKYAGVCVAESGATDTSVWTKINVRTEANEAS